MNEVDAVFRPDDSVSLSLFFSFVLSLSQVDDSLVTPIDDSDTLITFQLDDVFVFASL